MVSRRSLPRFMRNVLQSTHDARIEAAHELLKVIEEMFPDKVQELYALADRARAEGDEDADEDDPINVKARERYRAAISAWTAKNRIGSELINNVAESYGLDDRMVESRVRFYSDAEGEWIFAPGPWPLDSVDPYREEREAYLARSRKKAGEYYDHVVAFHQQHTGDRIGKPKRQFEHFKYLALNCVGGHSWAEIANGETPCDLPRSAQSTVSDGAHAVAKLLGIQMTGKRGPRKGARRHARRP